MNSTMRMKTKPAILTDDMLLVRHLNGIKAVARAVTPLDKTVEEHMQLPFDVFFKLHDSSLVKINERAAQTCSLDSPEDGVGRRIEDLFATESAHKVVTHDIRAMKYDQTTMLEYELKRRDGEIKRLLTVRTPWYDTNDNIMGIMGYGINLSSHSMVAAISHLHQTGLLASAATQSLLGLHPKLSRRELECAKLMMRGKNAHEMAETMLLSIRTVETYILNLKIKLNLTKKSELIEKLIDVLI